MKLPLVKKWASTDTEVQGNVAVPEMQGIIKNLAGVWTLLLILLLALFCMPSTSLWSYVDNGFPAMVMDAIQFVRILLIASIFPGVLPWTVRNVVLFQHALNLEYTGAITRGSILDKWAVEDKGTLHYYVRYSYLSGLNAKQKVNKTTFHQLECGDHIEVLYLSRDPSLSRLCVQ
jgi:hypothetical protein